MNILIIKLSAIGDVIHTLPSLAALRRLCPEANITWVIEDASSDLISGHPYLDSVIVSHRKQWIRDLKMGRISKPIREIRAFIDNLRRQPYDLVIDFHGLIKSSVIVLLSSGKRKLGYDSMQELSGLFLNEKIREDMNKHAVDRYLDFLRYLGADVGRPEFLIPTGEDNINRVEEILRRNEIDKKDPFVAVSPVALWDTKLWADEKFAGLCDRIAEELKVSVVFTGSEHGKLEHIQSRMKTSSVNLGGETTLRDLAYLYQRSALLITTDSGPMHLAAAVGTPVIALFGPTDPSRTGPYGKGHVVIRRELPCSPCFLKKCESMKCMADISVDEVFHAVKEKLSGRG
ncbi:MAG: glycosyltransferase family 9 protein [Syntrophales bacterium]|jgi:3-deoxy-D-manno-octulosonic-acid transferase/heptosyltransferase-1